MKNGFASGGVIARALPKHDSIEALIPSSVSLIEEKWMTYALMEAMNGIGWSAPNPSVGCVVIKDGQIIARGFTQNYGGKHAERMAFESLEKKFNLNELSGLDVYVTLEPCTHFGKQPPCVDLLLHPAVQNVWIGCEDPDHRVSGQGIELLKKTGKGVRVGVLHNEARAWHFPFMQSKISKKPVWVAKWAENENGLLADADGNSKWITNELSRAYTHWLRQKYDVILVGAGTWLKDLPRLNVRDCAEPHRRNPTIVIHDPKKHLVGLNRESGRFVFHDQTIEGLIDTVEKTDFGFELQSVFCEGGARTLSELFRSGRIDLVHRFIGRKDFGASKHRVEGFRPEKQGSPWVLETSAKFGNDFLQEWVKCS